MRSRSLLVTLLGLALLAAACGNDSPAASTTVPAPTSTAIASTTTTGAPPSSSSTANAPTTTRPAPVPAPEPGEPPQILWLADGMGSIARIDLAEQTCRRATVGLSADLAGVAHGFVWAVDCVGGQLVRFDITAGRETGRIDFGECPRSISFTDDSIWLALTESERVVELDPVTGEFLGELAAPGLLAVTAWNPGMALIEDGIYGYDDHHGLRGGADPDWISDQDLSQYDDIKFVADKPDWLVWLPASFGDDDDDNDDDDDSSSSSDSPPGALARRSAGMKTFLGRLDPATQTVAAHFSVPGRAFFAPAGSWWVATVPSRNAVVVLNDEEHRVFLLAGPLPPVAGGLIGIGSAADGTFLTVDVGQLGGGISVEEWQADLEPPDLVGQPGVTEHQVTSLCDGPLDMTRAAALGPEAFTDQHRIAAATNQALFPRHRPAFYRSDSHVRACPLDAAGTRVLAHVVPATSGISVKLDIHQAGTTLTGASHALTDDAGTALIEIPDPAGLDTSIDFEEAYELLIRPADEAPGNGCIVSMAP